MRRKLYKEMGSFNANYKISADYDLLLRCFKSPDFKTEYIPEILVEMQVGGVSNGTLDSFLTKTIEDFHVLRANKVWIGAIFFKKLFKFTQFF
jgi:glycosyltransferase